MGRNVSSAAAALMLAVCIGQGVSEAVRPRARAPAFKANSVMPDQSFNQLQLEDYVGKWVVLFFYPFDFTFGACGGLDRAGGGRGGGGIFASLVSATPAPRGAHRSLPQCARRSW